MLSWLNNWIDAQLACTEKRGPVAAHNTGIITRLRPEDAHWWHETLTTLLKGQIVLPINVSTDKGLPWSDADSGLPWTDHEGLVKDVKLGVGAGHVSVHLPGGYCYWGADIEIVPTKKAVFVRSMVGKNVCVWMLQVLTDIFPDMEGRRPASWSRFKAGGDLNAWRTAIDEQWQHRRKI